MVEKKKSADIAQRSRGKDAGLKAVLKVNFGV